MYACIYAYIANTILVCNIQKQKLKNKQQENRPSCCTKKWSLLWENLCIKLSRICIFSYLSKSVAQISQRLQNSVHLNINGGQCQTSTVVFREHKAKRVEAFSRDPNATGHKGRCLRSTPTLCLLSIMDGRWQMHLSIYVHVLNKFVWVWVCVVICSTLKVPSLV